MLQAQRPTTPPYRDRKRYAWLLSLVVPCTVGAGPALMVWTGNPLARWAPVAFCYLVAPLLDWMLGVDPSNPPESAVPALENDRYYRRITFLLVPVLWAAFLFSAWWVSTQPLAVKSRRALRSIPHHTGPSKGCTGPAQDFHTSGDMNGETVETR